MYIFSEYYERNNSTRVFEVTERVREGLRSNDLYIVPKARTMAGSRRISIFLPECINVVIRHSYLIGLSDFKTFVLFNITNFYSLFVGLRVKPQAGEDSDSD